MFVFKWFGPDTTGLLRKTSSGGYEPVNTTNAWQSFSVIDIILFVVVLGVIGLVLLRASGTAINLPVAPSAIVTGLGALGTILVLYRIIDPPDNSKTFEGSGIEASLEVGVFLGLIAVAGVTVGGWLAMREGTGFAEERRVRNPRRA